MGCVATVREIEGVAAARVEEAGLNALQTQRQLFSDGWLLRLSPGKARRARSVNAHFGSTLPLDAKIARCERLYAAHELPTLFRVTPFVQPPRLDDALVERRARVLGPPRVGDARVPAGRCRERAGARRLPQVRLRDRVHLPLPGAPGRVPMTRKVVQ